jgi:acyl carrier protein
MTEQVIDLAAARRDIHAKVIDLARRRGVKATDFTDDEPIPETGLLDSAGIMELIMWFETRFGVSVDQDELTIENFGTVDAMLIYLTRA